MTMADDQASQPREPTETQRRKIVATFSRRDLLKQTAVAGSLGIGGVVSSRRVGATESTDDSETIDDMPKDDGTGPTFGKVLSVEGTGTGPNRYRFSVGDTVTSEAVTTAQVEGADEPLITGEVREGCTDVYCFAGEVVGVSARGSITYHVHSP
jgi:hypothetical protein